MPTCGEHPSGPEVTCHLCHVAKLVGDAVEEGRIEVASAVVADAYEAEVKDVLDALGLEWALGIDVLASDYVIDVAKQLRAKTGE